MQFDRRYLVVCGLVLEIEPQGPSSGDAVRGQDAP